MKTISLGLLSVIGFAAVFFFSPQVKAASEPEKQDTAFSLLIEAFGEVQGAFIENDYQTQLQAAGSMADTASRRHACELAGQERDLRLGKLKRQLTEMALTYHYSRQTDERDTAASESEKVDPAAASRSLRTFILIGAGTVPMGDGTNATGSGVVTGRLPFQGGGNE
jgi:hypothetical protein